MLIKILWNAALNIHPAHYYIIKKTWSLSKFIIIICVFKQINNYLIIRFFESAKYFSLFN